MLAFALKWLVFPSEGVSSGLSRAVVVQQVESGEGPSGSTRQREKNKNWVEVTMS